ncbi:MAG: aminomethyltransferase beta-barrel domain-containing protein, partial [Polyangiaceae bacterium]
VGQRRGLGVALGSPAFVTRIDAETATVHLGPDEALRTRGAQLADVVLAEGAQLPMRARVRVRYRHEGDDATVLGDGRRGSVRAQVQFDHPVRAVTPGQTAVLYQGELVVGGGRIVSPLGAAAARR